MLDLMQFFTHFHLFEANDIPHVVIVHDIINLLETSIFTEDSDDEQMNVQVISDEDDDGMDEKANIHNFLHDDGFFDENGNLDYGVKLANFLPILSDTQTYAKKIISDNLSKTNQNDKENEAFLDEMIFIVGMECTDGEFEELYTIWRYFKFERFLRCDFDKHTNVVSIKYDTDKSEDGQQSQTPMSEERDDQMNQIERKSRQKRRKPPTVYCYVGSNHIDMIQKHRPNKN